MAVTPQPEPVKRYWTGKLHDPDQTMIVVRTDAAVVLATDYDRDIKALEDRCVRLGSDLAMSRKIRRYVAFVLTGNEEADVQLAADEQAATIERLRGLLAGLRDSTRAGAETGLPVEHLMLTTEYLAAEAALEETHE